MSISVSLVSATSKSNLPNSSGGGGTAIEVLQRKLASLQNDLKEALGSMSEEGQAKAKLIQMQILATQSQLQQLMLEESRKAAEKQNKNGDTAIQTVNQTSKPKTTYIDEYV